MISKLPNYSSPLILPPKLTYKAIPSLNPHPTIFFKVFYCFFFYNVYITMLSESGHTLLHLPLHAARCLFRRACVAYRSNYGM
jgi:hypothetical protein